MKTRFGKFYLLFTLLVLGGFFYMGANGYRLISGFQGHGRRASHLYPIGVIQHK